MLDIALYRKYRPQNFKQVLGQAHVTDVLAESVRQGSIAHAYLFAGSRGTGKTSVARILAKEIGTSDNDLFEIDAASNRGIDDVRALREAVNTMPFESKRKVYIIDEAHMLTKEAFNALLKTLEEPPKHVVFILATTELEKLPETIISRCQVFSFKKPSHRLLREMIQATAKAEGFTLEPAVADLIALLGDGSFRDAQGILQKVIGSSMNKKIELAEVERVTGAPSRTLVDEYVIALAENDFARGVKALRQASEKNTDFSVYAKLMLERVRAILLLKYAPAMEASIKEEVSDEEFILLAKLAHQSENKINSQTLLELLDASTRLRFSAIPELPLELALAKLTIEREIGN
ncbi:MAG: DNA polymerase III subunit gamma/tau [bacterium]|nr:DNA polymerase III subunit gamma/tau [bacterium]